LLGTETHSLSRPDAWKRAIVAVGRLPDADTPHAFMLATDGFSNSYSTEAAFLQTCVEYYAAIREHGADAVSGNLNAWLNETSENGSGDDITVVFGVM
jgi:serine/threonine protein phosphatase PrpC